MIIIIIEVAIYPAVDYEIGRNLEALRPQIIFIRIVISLIYRNVSLPEQL